MSSRRRPTGQRGDGRVVLGERVRRPNDRPAGQPCPRAGHRLGLGSTPAHQHPTDGDNEGASRSSCSRRSCGAARRRSCDSSRRSGRSRPAQPPVVVVHLSTCVQRRDDSGARHPATTRIFQDAPSSTARPAGQRGPPVDQGRGGTCASRCEEPGRDRRLDVGTGQCDGRHALRRNTMFREEKVNGDYCT